MKRVDSLHIVVGNGTVEQMVCEGNLPDVSEAILQLRTIVSRRTEWVWSTADKSGIIFCGMSLVFASQIDPMSTAGLTPLSILASAGCIVALCEGTGEVMAGCCFDSICFGSAVTVVFFLEIVAMLPSLFVENLRCESVVRPLQLVCVVVGPGFG